MPESSTEMDFMMEVGADAEVRTAGRPAMTEDRPTARGLALRELTLKRTYEGRLSRIFRRNRENEIFFITTAFDMSEKPPQSYPEEAEDAERVWIPMVAGETYRFTLGVGAPIWGPRPVVGGIAVAIIVGESDQKSRQAGEHIKEAAEAFKSDDSISAFLGKLVTSPASIPADIVFGVLGKAAAAAGSILSKNNHEHVGLFRGLFLASDKSWEGMLEQDERGASVKLAETS